MNNTEIKITRKNCMTRTFRLASIDDVKAIIEVVSIDPDTGMVEGKREYMATKLDTVALRDFFPKLTRGQLKRLASMFRELVPESLQYTYQTY